MKDPNQIQTTNEEISRILIVDDHPLVRESLKMIVQKESDLMVCGEAEDREQALEMAATVAPHLVLVDLTLKNSHGLELIKDLRNRFPEIKTLVLSMQEETIYAERVIRAGASGYIGKEEAPRKDFTGHSKDFGGRNILERNALRPRRFQEQLVRPG